MAGHVDVAVVGGGPAGAVCAALLAQRGFHVALIIDSRRRLAWSDLLSPTATAMLDRLGFPSVSMASVARPCLGVVDRWLSGLPMYTDFELVRFRCGWVVDRGSFDQSLVKFAEECGVDVSDAPFSANLVTSPSNLDSVMTIRREGIDEQWFAQFVIDATGASGRLLPDGDNRRIRHDRLIAVRVTLDTAPAPTDWMHLGASSSGWWYTLSGANGVSHGIFMTDNDLLPHSQTSLRRHLAMEFQDAFPDQQREPVLTEPITFRDARTTCRRRWWTGRWLPIGDARVSLDPLTGAGLERAVESAEVAANLVSQFLKSACFQRLEANAIESLIAFNVTLDDLNRYYRAATDNEPRRNGPFWQRRISRQMTSSPSQAE